MKRSAILFMMFFIASLGNISARNYGSDISFNFFYNSLSPYGEWIEIDYDVYAWRPTSVHVSWQPYTIGRWEWTSYGWYWDSYEPFGWAAYHYGRWYYDDYYGWLWIPDYEWGPAWVEWRYNDVYIGWTPLPPYASFRIGIGIHFSINWHSNYYHWNFVPFDHFCHYDVNYYIINSTHKYRVFSTTKYRTNYYYDDGRIVNGGVDRSYIEKRSGNKITERNLETTSKLRDNTGDRSRGDRIEVYKPSTNDLEKTRDIREYNIIRSESKSSLRIDKITQRNKSDNTNGRSKGSVISKGSRANDGILKPNRNNETYNPPTIKREGNVKNEKDNSNVDKGFDTRNYKKNESSEEKSQSIFRNFGSGSKSNTETSERKIFQPKSNSGSNNRPEVKSGRSFSNGGTKSVERNKSTNKKPETTRKQSRK
ncbi:MAG: hypothetical protein A2V66_05940 [Ignavibacteria bacterium RBG_13_36_8]|nr:MAG: hypothetical protein A2V66_05940 [Ignavibacteria bacterium RBG_13_36_8]